jgi:hypothetical protein
MKTAEELFREKFTPGFAAMPPRIPYYIYESMIEFAQMHVEAALKKATHVLDVNNDADYIEYPTPRRILNSYPLTNIK